MFCVVDQVGQSISQTLISWRSFYHAVHSPKSSSSQFSGKSTLSERRVWMGFNRWQPIVTENLTDSCQRVVQEAER